jgi:hypothetical protein
VEYNDGGNVKLKISVPQNSYIDVRMKNLEIKDEIDTIICKTMIFLQSVVMMMIIMTFCL